VAQAYAEQRIASGTALQFTSHFLLLPLASVSTATRLNGRDAAALRYLYGTPFTAKRIPCRDYIAVGLVSLN